MATMKFFGSRVKRVEDGRFLRGRAQFVDDIHLPGTLHIAFVRSAHAHARIKTIDASKAQSLAGVRRIVVGSELETVLKPLGCALDLPTFKETKWPCLAVNKVRYVGELVALVVAESRYIAEDAAELIDVDYDILPAVTDPEQGMEANAPLVHEELGDNMILQLSDGGGDVDGAFRQAAFVLKERFRTNRHSSVPLETRGTLATISADGEITLWSSTQIPHVLRNRVAEVMDFPEQKLRVIGPDVGGGFGPKAHVHPEEVLTAFLARELDSPVKWIEDRREHLLGSHHAKDEIIDCEMGFAADGTIVGMRARIVGDLGAYNAVPWTSPLEPVQLAGALPGPYKIQDYHYDIYAVATNKMTLSAYRGVGLPAAVMVQEQLMDLAARRLEMDPVAIRRKNLIPPSEFPYQTVTGQTYDSSSSTDALDKALSMMDYDGFRRRQAEARGRDRYLGIGICTYIEVTTFGTGFWRILGAQNSAYESANVRMDAHGGVELSVGTFCHGQGHYTTYAQIVADELGINVEDVQLIQGDTRATPIGWGTWGSRSVVAGGGAVFTAARKVKEKMLRLAGHALEVNPADLELVPGKIQVKGVPTKSVTIKDIAHMGVWSVWKMPEGEDPGLEANHYYEPPPATYTNATHIAEVEVDIHTGMVSLQRYGVIEDCGKMINPMIVDAQVAGGVAQGIGNALYEHLQFDDSGQLLTTSLMDYLVPTAADVPDLQIDHIETPSPWTIEGVKGMGEGGAIGAPSAVVNAVGDALQPFGVKVTELPLTPERVWQLAHGSRAQ